MKRIWLIIRYWVFWLAMLAYAVLVMSAVSARADHVNCQEIRVSVKDSLVFRFVERQDVGEMLLREGGPLLGNPLTGINTDEIERKVEKHPFVRNAEAYATSDGLLHVEISQRQPLLRLMGPGQRDLYLDEEGFLVPNLERKPARILICNGSLPDPGSIRSATPVDSVRNADWYRQVYELSRFIADHPFWNDQFEQLYVRPDRELELIPRVGPHMILLGPVSGYREKLHKLLVLYDEGLSRLGWNQYEWINLKYQNQVVCTKR